MRKIIITIVGLFITLVGVVLFILPGPAFLLIPVGLAILALEYPWARKWLRQFQRWMTAAAQKADLFVARKFKRKSS
ncbi:PGPGW domain-containing protein [Aliikangiella sp. GXAS 311]|uniref:PGPGW domain-containing protein n=3 Tax=Aliikangiella maris TaxID=3162458 RepID=A0ABV3MQW5_9GAMM